jgi:hypothetical protein
MLLAGRIKEGGGKRVKQRKKGERMTFSPYLSGTLTQHPMQQTARVLSAISVQNSVKFSRTLHLNRCCQNN